MANPMLRVLLLVIVGFIGALAVIRAIGAGIALIIDLQNNAKHTAGILGTLTFSIIIAMACSWPWRKLCARKDS
jgi:hypothetical protein